MFWLSRWTYSGVPGCGPAAVAAAGTASANRAATTPVGRSEPRPMRDRPTLRRSIGQCLTRQAGLKHLRLLLQAGRKLPARPDRELLEHVAQVRLDGLGGDEEGLGDLAVGVSLGRHLGKAA